MIIIILGIIFSICTGVGIEKGGENPLWYLLTIPWIVLAALLIRGILMILTYKER